MKKSNRNVYWISCLAVVLALGLCLAMPGRIGQSHEPEASPVAVFTVTNNLNTGTGSFRQAIIDANASAGTDTIQFQIGTGPVNINLSSALPDITQPVIIDGTTQPGFSGTPLINIGGGFNDGLKITGGGSTVRAVAVRGSFFGITFENGGGNTIAGSFIGICPQNPTASCGNATGVRINNSPNNVIGGMTAADRNIISGNVDKGIEITGSASTGNIITGNYIGRLADGSVAGNENFGVAIIGAPNNRIGGSLAGERNFISKNAASCNLPGLFSNSNVFISGAAATGNSIEGNYIGTTIDGTGGGDSCVGVRIENAANNTIGGTAGTTPGGACTGACNLISGYGGTGNRSGVTITGSGATGNSVLGNFIGTNAAGTARVNNDVGVTITAGASNNTVGGTTAAGRNLINNGIMLTAGAATNTVQGNYIGTDTTGNTGIGFLPGGGNGAAVSIDSAPNNSIGTTAGTTLGGACTGGCNLISGNNLLGVLITGAGSMGNRVDYNYIGLNAAGTAALRNLGGAIRLQNGASNNIIGRPLTATPFQAPEACVNNASLTVRCVQDDLTGDWIQFDDVTGQFTWTHCRSGVMISGVGEVIISDTLVRLRSPGVGIVYDTSSGDASAFIVPPPGSFLNDLIIDDSNVSDSTCVCPTEGMQIFVGDVTNAANNNIFNFVSVGFDTTGTINHSTPQDGNVFNASDNSNVYSNIFLATNGGVFPAVEIGAGNDNFITGLNVTALNPGQYVNRPIVLGPGANRNIPPPQNLTVFQVLGGAVEVIGTFSGMPNTNYRISISGFNRTTLSSGATLTQVNPTGTTFLIRTNANGNYNINQVYTGVDAFALLGSERVAAVITQINAVPIASEGSAASFVDVPGDTSEFSLPAVVPQPKFDRDNDGKTDFIVYRPGATANEFSFWYVLNSSDFTFRVVQFGNGEDKVVGGDYQGDGVADFAVFRPSTGTWYNSRITGNPTTNFVSTPWGTSTDIPVPGDYDGDGTNDAAIFRPSGGTWWIRRSIDGSFYVQQWGLATDKLVPADYDGDGDTDIAVYRSGTWYISACPACPVRYEQFGLANDVPVPADYDGDGQADIAVWRPSEGIWYLKQSTAGFSAVRWGLATDKALNGDFDADGKNDIAVWRPSDGNWYILRSIDGNSIFVHWGQNGDVPVPMFLNAQ